MSEALSLPSAALGRLIQYLRILEDLEVQGVSHISSTLLAARVGVTSFQVRKDLTYLGRFGTRGTGYAVPLLRRELLRVMGLNQTWNVVIVGLGRLGQALAHSGGVGEQRFKTVGLFDSSSQVIGQEVCGLTVQSVHTLPTFVQQLSHTPLRVDMGLLAVPPEQAQVAAQALAAAGVNGILNFAPVVIQVQDLPQKAVDRPVIVENVDFFAGMKRLAFRMLSQVTPVILEEMV